MLDLYKLFKDPSDLCGHDIAYETIPGLVWDKYYYTDHAELKNKEHLWKLVPEYSYRYAAYIIQRRFPEGEAVIATDALYSCLYNLYLKEI